SWARRSLAAETIFIARVICWVFLTERMRRRMSIRLGMCRVLGLLGDEARFEIRNGVLKPRAQIIVERLLVADLVTDLAVGVVHEPVQLLLELAALVDRQIVQKRLRAGEDDDDLPFERKR